MSLRAQWQKCYLCEQPIMINEAYVGDAPHRMHAECDAATWQWKQVDWDDCPEPIWFVKYLRAIGAIRLKRKRRIAVNYDKVT